MKQYLAKWLEHMKKKKKNLELQKISQLFYYNWYNITFT